MPTFVRLLTNHPLLRKSCCYCKRRFKNGGEAHFFHLILPDARSFEYLRDLCDSRPFSNYEVAVISHGMAMISDRLSQQFEFRASWGRTAPRADTDLCA